MVRNNVWSKENLDTDKWHIRNVILPTKVFISHAERDKPSVQKVIDFLEDIRGAKCWVDRKEMGPTSRLSTEIEQGIEKSDVFCLFITPDAISSSWVNKEINKAISVEDNRNSKFLLPCLIRPTELPKLLQDRLYAMFYPSFNRGLEDLENGISKILEDRNFF